MSWWALLPAAFALLALWLLPGWAVLWCLRVRGLIAFGAAPAVTAAVVGALGIVYSGVGVRWSLASMTVGSVLVAALAVATGRVLLPTRAWRGMLVLPDPLDRRTTALLAVSLALAAVLVGGPMMAGMGVPDRPEQAWDAVFHLNAVALVRESGDASTLGALASLYGGGRPYYPTVWHAVAAIAPGLPVVPAAANLQNLVLAALVWPLGIASLTRAAVPSGPAVLVAPVLAGAFVGFPTVVLTVLAPWPFGLSVAVLPGAVAALLIAVRTPWRRGSAAAACAALFSVAGVVAAHGSGAFSLVVVAGPLVVAALTRQARRWWLAGRASAVATAAAVTVAALALTTMLLVRLPSLRVTLGYERAGAESYLPALQKLLHDVPLVYRYGEQGPAHLVVNALVVVGAVACMTWRRGRWLVVAGVVALALAALAAGPAGNPLRPLTGYWYTQAARIAPLAVVPAVVLAAWGSVVVAGWPTRWLRLIQAARGRTVGSAAAGRGQLVGPAVLALVVVAVTSGLRWELREQVTASVYDPGEIAWGTMLSADELAMMDRLPEKLPAGAVVLGDPFNGSAYLPALAGVDVVFPQLGAVHGAPSRVLEGGLEQIGSDPAVCAAIRSLGVTHLYTDTAGMAEGAKVHERTVGLRSLSTVGDLDLVDRAGTSAVWKLRTCQEIDPGRER